MTETEHRLFHGAKLLGTHQDFAPAPDLWRWLLTWGGERGAWFQTFFAFCWRWNAVRMVFLCRDGETRTVSFAWAPELLVRQARELMELAWWWLEIRRQDTQRSDL